MMRARRQAVAWVAIVAVALVFCVSCAMSPAEQARAVAAIGEMLRSGAITIEQHDALLAALTGGDWLDSTLQLVLPIVGAWLGVPWVASLARGKVGNRKGLAEALAHLPTTPAVSRVGAAADAVAAGIPATTPEPLRSPSTGGA